MTTNYSCMHYSPWTCAKSKSKPTMMFQLSVKDIQHIKVIDCPSKFIIILYFLLQ